MPKGNRANELLLEKTSLLFLIFSSFAIAYYYRNGGTRDFGLYIKAGSAFVHGENAYLTQGWRSGSFGSAFVWLISWPIPNVLKVYFIQTITFAGFWVFSRRFAQNNLNSYWTLGLILFLSPVREVINTLQITGFVFGLLAFFLSDIKVKTEWIHKIISALKILSLAVAFDLKPHSIIFILFLLAIKNYKRKQMLLAVLVDLIGHGVVDFINGNFLEYHWFRGIANVGNASGVNGESTSIWKVIDHYSNSKIDTKLISILFILGALAVFFKLLQKASINQILIYGLTASSFLTYMHYYDLAPLAIVVLVMYLETKNSIIGFSLIMFLFLPREIQDPVNLLVLIILILISLLAKLSNRTLENFSKFYLIKIFLAALTYGAFQFANSVMESSYRLGHAVMTSETMLLTYLFIYLQHPSRFRIDFGKRKQRSFSS